jgi:hypothetical protein
MGWIRKNAIALTALVFAMTGTGMAASHYMISSTRQISPKVLKQLRGRTGARGLPGPAGAGGSNGKEGPQGPAGPLLTTLPAGRTQTGVYGAEGSVQVAVKPAFASASISFQLPLAANPATHFIHVKESAPPQCPGSVTNPQAASGNLCIYEGQAANAKNVTAYDPVNLEADASSRFGAVVSVESIESIARFYSEGSWAVTG